MYDLNYLKSIKKQKNFTNKDIAEKSGVPLGTINKIFSGAAELKEVVCKKIEKILLCQEGERQTFGKIKCVAAGFKVKLGDIDSNVNAICKKIEELACVGTTLAVFPEMCICGYTLSDLFYQTSLLDKVESGLGKIKEFSAKYPVMFFVGAPFRWQGKIYNVAVCFCKGKILGLTAKTYLPTYNEFYESRQFCSSPDEPTEVTVCGEKCKLGKNLIYVNDSFPLMRVGCEICEDLWVSIPPSTYQALGGATVIANLSASDEVIGKAEYRRQIVSTQSAKQVAGYVYSDAGYGESTTDLVFAGHNLVYENGKMLSQSKLFSGDDAVGEIDLEFIEFERSKILKYSFKKEDCCYINFDLKIGFESQRVYPTTPFVPKDKNSLEARAELILAMQAQGLMRRVDHVKCKTVVIGISGGLDSALALLVAVRAFKMLGRDTKEITAVTMPCFGTTERTKQNAITLSECLGVSLKYVDITKSVLQHFEDIGQDPSVTDVTYENCQARERTQVLMDIANKMGGIVVGTGDLSELALGWATYNGDHMSNYGVNSSIPKTLVKYLVGYEATRLGDKIKNTLNDILDTPVSPELIPAEKGQIKQKTEDLVGPYVLHDFFLYHFIREGAYPEKLFDMAIRSFGSEFDEKTIIKWLEIFFRRFFSQQFKRSCLPDGVKVGTVVLSPRGDWRMPSDAYNSAWQEQIQTLKIKYGI